MKRLVTSFLLGFLALSIPPTIAGGDFHNHVPSLWHHAATNLSIPQNGVLDENLNRGNLPATLYNCISLSGELSIDEVAEALNTNLITPDDALCIAFEKKRIDIAEYVIRHMPTATEEQRKKHICAIKATDLYFSAPKTFSDINKLFTPLTYIQEKASSGLSKELVMQAQELPLPESISTLAHDFWETNTIDANADIILSERLRFLRRLHRETEASIQQEPTLSPIFLKKAIFYDFLHAFTRIASQELSLTLKNFIEFMAKRWQEDSFNDHIIFGNHMSRLIVETLQKDVSPRTIKQLHFLLKASSEDTVSLHMIDYAARQNKKEFISMLLTKKRSLGRFKRILYQAKGGIPRHIKDSLLASRKNIKKIGIPLVQIGIAAYIVHSSIKGKNRLDFIYRSQSRPKDNLYYGLLSSTLFFNSLSLRSWLQLSKSLERATISMINFFCQHE